MSVEENTQVVSRYKGWNTLPSEVVIDNILTVNRESNRQPDPWHFLVGKKGLFSEKWGRYVSDVVAEFPHPNKYLKETETQILNELDEWSNLGDSGVAIWFSPSYDGEYDTNKIEIVIKGYTFGDMKLATQNVCILFDCTPNVVLEIARKIFPDLETVTNPEDLRKMLITKSELNIEQVIEIIKPYIPENEDYLPVSQEVLDYLSGLVRSGVNQVFIAQEMNRLGAIGKHSFSCNKATSGLSYILEKSSANYDMRDKTSGCKQCGTTVGVSCGWCKLCWELFGQ